MGLQLLLMGEGWEAGGKDNRYSRQDTASLPIACIMLNGERLNTIKPHTDHNAALPGRPQSSDCFLVVIHKRMVPLKDK